MAPNAYQNRIIGHGEEPPENLLANARNFRRHPKHQQDALQGVLAEIGWVQDVIVNQRTNTLVDGHLRVELAMRNHQPTIPVVYVDLTDDEEALVLATLDPIAALATTDRDQLDALLREVGTGDAAVQQMLADMATNAGIAPPEWDDAFDALPSGDRAPIQQMTFTVSDEQAAVIDRALAAAKGSGPFGETGNENSNGNAIARVCEAYVTR